MSWSFVLPGFMLLPVAVQFQRLDCSLGVLKVLR